MITRWLRRTGSPWRAALVVVVVVTSVGACAVGTGPEHDEAPPEATGRPSSGPGRALLAVPVVPVGGDRAEGRQTLAGALADVASVAAGNAGAVRVVADLRWLCPTEVCRPAPLDPIVSEAAALGLDVYMHVNSTPAWMATERWSPPRGAQVAAWADLFGQLVARYGTAVAGYEVWNEPNLEEFWLSGPDPGAYADLLKGVWLEVQDVDPQATLVGAVLSNNDLGYMAGLSAALRERGGDAENGYFYDVLGVHPYAGDATTGFDPGTPAGSADSETTFGVKDMTFLGIDRLREQVARDEGVWRDVVIGEFGYTTESGGWYHVAEPLRAEYLSEAIGLARRREWIRSFTVYSYSGYPDDGFSVLGTRSEKAVGEA